MALCNLARTAQNISRNSYSECCSLRRGFPTLHAAVCDDTIMGQLDKYIFYELALVFCVFSRRIKYHLMGSRPDDYGFIVLN